jgi:energy-coupling factor transporter ATP-binding protein EcfA2
MSESGSFMPPILKDIVGIDELLRLSSQKSTKSDIVVYERVICHAIFISNFWIKRLITTMRFSYKVDGQFLIKSALIPVDTGKVYLVTGEENSGFGLIGGVIAKLFPIREKLEWTQLQALIKDYTGKLSIEEGELPQSTAYVDVDPDRNLFFSKVKEEMMVQINNSNIEVLASNLSKFGLDKSFLERRICNLSGGEKMKVALAIAFSLDCSCYVLHGVIPWLDKKGREQLKNGGSLIINLKD